MWNIPYKYYFSAHTNKQFNFNIAYMITKLNIKMLIFELNRKIRNQVDIILLNILAVI